jgi:hypothetical protein
MAAVEPRDPHAMWWVEHQRLPVEHENSCWIREHDYEKHRDNTSASRSREPALEHACHNFRRGLRSAEGASVGIEFGFDLEAFGGAIHNMNCSHHPSSHSSEQTADPFSSGP